MDGDKIYIVVGIIRYENTHILNVFHLEWDANAFKDGCVGQEKYQYYDDIHVEEYDVL